MAPVLDRHELFADRSLVGTTFCRAYSRRVDEWLAAMFDEVAGDRTDVALAAVGGYGRAELSPQSDIDVMLLHEKGTDVDDLANTLWYPIWDEGLKLGHSVRSPREALALAATDLETATSLLSLRHVAGDKALVRQLRDGAAAQWARKAKRWLPTMFDRFQDRHKEFGELAFLLEPDLKSSEGGLRDAHVLSWLAAADNGLDVDVQGTSSHAYEVLLAARVELHRSTNRLSNVLLLEEQDAVAAALHYDDADLLMADIAASAREIAWTAGEAWRAVSSRRSFLFRSPRARVLSPGLGELDGSIVLLDAVDLDDPLLTLRVVELAARNNLVLPRATLERLAFEAASLTEPWTEEARRLFEDTLLAGHQAIPVLESLDHFGLLHRLVPEWEPTRSRPQRNAYHRFTVDRHLLETAAQAALVVDRVSRPGLLVVGALLHDIGKGYPGDHTEVGIEMIPTIARRMGYPDDDVALLVDMCRHHLLLPDVATRRDIDDPDIIIWVADQVKSITTLELLDALTEADSIATGPSAWSRWKAGLVRSLVDRTRLALESGDVSTLTSEFPSAEQVTLMAARERQVLVDADTITVVMPDVHASLWRVAGTLALHGLDVLQADVHSENGMAIEVYRVEAIFGEVDAQQLTDDVWRALEGRLAVFARLEERVNVYEPSVSRAAARPMIPTSVSFDNVSSTTATVVEVAAADSLGLLCRLTHALSEQGLDISRSKVQTLGESAVDSFYVTDIHGNKITDTEHLEEIRASIEYSLLHRDTPS
jgi:[protein-PII] uridylyltransferase